MRALCIVLLACACGGDDTPRARVFKVQNESSLIGGPGALGAVGDYKLENDKIEVVIHGPGPNRGLLIYGGSIIDADLQRPGNGNGRDILGEVSPIFMLESFVPTKYTVEADGSDGGPAILKVSGEGGDLLQAAFILNTALLLPQSLGFDIEYILEPGSNMVEIRTTITNRSAAPRDFPALSSEDILSQFDVPAGEDIDFAVPMGHLLLIGRGTFSTGSTGYNTKFGVRREYPKGRGLPGFPGIVTEYFARKGDGVSYGFAVPEADHNYVGRYQDRYPLQSPTSHSMVMPFEFAGATAVFHSDPPKTMASGEKFTYSAFLVVGDGDVASVSDRIFRHVHEKSLGRFSGRMLDAQSLQPTSGEVVIRDPQTGYVTTINPDPEGVFSADLEPGRYLYQVVSRGRKTTDDKELVITENETTYEDLFLEPLGRLMVNVFDEKGRALPCKLSLVGEHLPIYNSLDPRDFLYSLEIGEPSRPTDFDPAGNEYLELARYTASGAIELTPEPGTYKLVISRGPEYELSETSVTIVSGKTQTLDVVLERAFQSSGYIAMDSHIHSQNSMDSDLNLTTRVWSIAGEGIEFAVATDHNFITDYGPIVRRDGLENWLTPTTGLEVTSYEMGHFNGYPLRIDPQSPRGGDVLWAGKPPDEIFNRLREVALHGAEEVIVQVNHARGSITGYFNAFNFSQDTGNIVPHNSDGASALFRPTGVEFDQENFSLNFDAFEIINGKRHQETHTGLAPDPLPPGPFPDGTNPVAGEPLRDEDGEIEFPGVLEDWFSLLNRGKVTTGVGTSDSHSTVGQEPGYARTYVWVGEDKDEVGEFTDKDVVAGIKSRRAIVSTGPFVEFFIDDTPIGSIAPSVGGTANLRIVGKAASWSPLETLTIYANGKPVKTESIPQGQQTDFEIMVPITITEDTYFVVEATGRRSLFPVVMPVEFEPFDPNQLVDGLLAGIDIGLFSGGWGDLEPALQFRKTPWVITNPLWADFDGDGQFTPPGDPLPANPGQEFANSLDIYDWFNGVSQQ